MSASDSDTLKLIEAKVGRPLRYRLAAGRCVELELTADDCPYHGLIRRHSAAEKEAIMALVCRLSALRKLDLRRNRLGRLPERFQDLRELEHLTLGSNYLGEVPPQIRGFAQLRFLHLGNNDLARLPSFIGDFERLEYLALHKNLKLRAIDPLAGLTNLRALNLYFLNLGGLPAFVYDLGNLVTLTLCHTSNLSDEIGRLTKLEFLTNCCSLGMRTLPDGLTQLKSLRMMRLFQNNLECLPENIGELKNLEQLSVYQNQLARLPDSFARLGKLKKLNLGWNRFETLPGWLGRLPALEWVGLFENPLQADSIAFAPGVRVERTWPFTTLPQMP